MALPGQVHPVQGIELTVPGIQVVGAYQGRGLLIVPRQLPGLLQAALPHGLAAL